MFLELHYKYFSPLSGMSLEISNDFLDSQEKLVIAKFTFFLKSHYITVYILYMSKYLEIVSIRLIIASRICIIKTYVSRERKAARITYTQRHIKIRAQLFSSMTVLHKYTSTKNILTLPKNKPRLVFSQISFPSWFPSWPHECQPVPGQKNKVGTYRWRWRERWDITNQTKISKLSLYLIQGSSPIIRRAREHTVSFSQGLLFYYNISLAFSIFSYTQSHLYQVDWAGP